MRLLWTLILGDPAISIQSCNYRQKGRSYFLLLPTWNGEAASQDPSDTNRQVTLRRYHVSGERLSSSQIRCRGEQLCLAHNSWKPVIWQEVRGLHLTFRVNEGIVAAVYAVSKSLHEKYPQYPPRLTNSHTIRR